MADVPNYTESIEFSYELYDVQPDVEGETVAQKKGQYTTKQLLMEFFDLSAVSDTLAAEFPDAEGWVLDDWSPSRVHDSVDLVNVSARGMKRSAP